MRIVAAAGPCGYRLCSPESRPSGSEPDRDCAAPARSVAIAEAVADLRGLTEQAVCTGGIAAEHALQRGGKQQIAVLDTILMTMLEQLARA